MPASNMLVKMEETEAIAYASREETVVTAPAARVVVKDVALSVQEAKKVARRDKKPIVYEERNKAALQGMAAACKAQLTAYDPALIVWDAREAATRDTALITCEPNASSIVEEAMMSV